MDLTDQVAGHILPTCVQPAKVMVKIHIASLIFEESLHFHVVSN